MVIAGTDCPEELELVKDWEEWVEELLNDSPHWVVLSA